VSFDKKHWCGGVGGGGGGGGGEKRTELLFVHLERTYLKLPQFGINPKVLEYDSANSVTCYFKRATIFLYTRDPNWIPPEYKVAMSALSQSD